MHPCLCVARSCSPSGKKDWTSLLQRSLPPSPDLVKISHSAFLWCPVIFLQKNSSLIVQSLLPHQILSSRATTFAYCSPQHIADRPWERYNRWATHICQREEKLGSVNYIRAHHNCPRARPGCKPLRGSGGTGNCLWAGTICPSLQVPEIFLMFWKILFNLLVAWKGSELVILKMKAPLVSDYLGASIPHKYFKFLKISLTLSQFIYSWLILNSLLRLDLGQILPGLTIIRLSTSPFWYLLCAQHLVSFSIKCFTNVVSYNLQKNLMDLEPIFSFYR